jgi:hypothetical protein
MTEERFNPDHGRYAVVRYPTYYVVIDQHRTDAVVAGVSGQHPIVYETRNPDAAHNKMRKLNREWHNSPESAALRQKP